MNTIGPAATPPNAPTGRRHRGTARWRRGLSVLASASVLAGVAPTGVGEAVADDSAPPESTATATATATAGAPTPTESTTEPTPDPTSDPTTEPSPSGRQSVEPEDSAEPDDAAPTAVSTTTAAEAATDAPVANTLAADAPAVAAAEAAGCGYGEGGRYDDTICWLDMSTYDDTTARTADGQSMSVTLPGGYRLSYTIKTRTADGYANAAVTSRAVPIETRFAFATEAYENIPGRPSLYSSPAPGTNGLDVELSNIRVEDPSGTALTSFAFVATDTEDNISGESLRWTSDKPLNHLETLYDQGSKGCKPATMTGFGTTTVTCTGVGGASTLAEKSTSVLVSADAPTTFALRWVTPAQSGIAFGVNTASIEVSKVVEGRAEPSDSFDVSLRSPEGTELGSASTGTGNTATTGPVVVIPPNNGEPFTLTDAATAGSGTDLADYTHTWACTRNGAPDPSLPSGEATSVQVSPGTGDQIACTVTNRARPMDGGDAPASYGTTFDADGARHRVPGYDATTHTAPLRLGALIDLEADGAPTPTAQGDDTSEVDDEDGVDFNTDVSVPGRLETVYVTSSAAGFVNGWIDFDRDGEFDGGVEQILSDRAVTAGVNRLTYTVPEGSAFVGGETTARFRLTSAAGVATSPTGSAPDGEVEDHARTLFDAGAFALEQCPRGSVPVPVGIVQNRSFESYERQFQNSTSANTINWAEHWYDSHPSGGQYYVLSPSFDSGPAASVMPFRAGADGYGFLGGHSSTPGDSGEGATNTLTEPLVAGAAYVGFFSTGAGGHGRGGSGYLRMFGVDSPNVGSLYGSTGTNLSASNSEALYDTPVVRPAAAGTRAQWSLATFTLRPSRSWDYLRLEARNETPANNGTPAGQTWMTFDDFHMYLCDPIRDFGDAPASYGTELGSGAAFHEVPDFDAATNTAPLMLGRTIDVEDDGVAGPDADSDDTTADDDEDALPDAVRLALGATAPSLDVPVTNDTGGPATLHGWIDANGDGVFQSNEHASASVAAGASSATLQWSGLSPLMAETRPVVRLRLTTDDLADDSATAVDERSRGLAQDGEVEDHVATVSSTTLTCATDAAVFNTAYDGAGGRLPVGSRDAGWEVGLGTTAGPGSVTSWIPAYVVQPVAGAWATSPYDNADWISHDPSRAHTTTGDFFYRYQFRIAAEVPLEGFALPMDFYADNSVWEVYVNDVAQSDSQDSLPQNAANPYFHNGFGTGRQASTLLADGWRHGLNTIVVHVKSGNPSVEGFMAQMTPQALCNDYGDAPDSYGSDQAGDGPRHGVADLTADGTSSLMLGDSIDAESDATLAGTADGDDTTGVDDEDGVAAPIVMTAGEPTTVQIAATNHTGAAATLVGWLDLDGDGAFEAAERVTVPVGAGTATYPMVFPAGPETTTTAYARFRLYPGTVTAALPTGPADAGEVEDYPVQVLTRALSITKTSDATEESRPGDQITYTVTATNTGDGAFTAANPARVVDDLAGALDDAEYNLDAAATVDGNPVAAPTYSAPRIRWAGPLAGGTSVVLTYTVTLTGGGDGTVRNVAWAPTTVDPGPTPDCDDPATTVPCDDDELLLPKLQITKQASRNDLPAVGGEMTYTVTVRNVGPGTFTATAPATFRDDLSDVEDDADLVGSPTASGGTATYAAPEITWSGALAPAEQVTVTYAVVYHGEGDQSLVNRACVPGDDAVDPQDACRSTTTPGSGLDQAKTADPPSGTPVDAGDEVTYTLRFSNTGQTAATVDTSDDLSDVLDDATLVRGPTADSGLTATVVGDRIDIDGTVPVGETRYVTYTVEVDTYADQVNHVLGNVLACQPGDPTSCRPEVTRHGVRHLNLTKSSTPPAVTNTGDTVTYTLTVENDGAGDYTAAEPATVVDDLSDVLDDATYLGDAEATAGTVSYAEPELTWTGTLAAGDSVTITYTVTVTNLGDHDLVNTASVPGCDDPSCNPPAVETLLPHVVPSKTSDPASGVDVAAGEVITYTLTWTNDGQAAGPVDATDDLSRVLDDADVSREPASSDPDVTAVRTDESLRVTGTIDPGETISVSYEVTVRPDGRRGDNLLRNVLTPDVPQVSCDDAGDCEPVDPPTTEHKIGELDDWKTVEPGSGTTVRVGDELAYTLHFTNTGTADVEVDRDDVLTGVLDDARLVAGPTASDAALTASGPRDGRISVTGTLSPGQTVTVGYAVRVKPASERGDDLIGNYLLAAGEEPPVDCGPTAPARRMADAAHPDCTVNPVSNIVASKSVAPGGGAEAEPGDVLTYTLRFENTGQGPGEVEHVDDLSDVLDDARLVSEPAFAEPNAMTAVVKGDRILIKGTLAAGAVDTVSYAVVVKEAARQGNSQLANFLMPAGEKSPSQCDPDSGTCTTNGVLSGGESGQDDPDGGPDDDLPGVGSPVRIGLIVGAALLVIAGIALLVLGRRRREPEDAEPDQA
ncbi:MULTISPECIES: GEVED domain-containing protein [Nocardioides]|uniref:GEVED domain-containing protein n=1 Tax=Nocardioides vastitatis TaxID=2568655 RepID=A0ABW0ZKD4_9ACTN|nr:GEVED domain-containing protein [Nocardioides sp.]THJ14720.1 DUF11 domain-containing protein [Nocardioides sp.]